MAGYKYGGTETIEQELRRQEQLRADLETARAEYKEAQRVRRENERIQAEIERMKQRTAELASPLPTLPEPIHGGPLGLRRAAAELDAWNRRQRAERKAA